LPERLEERGKAQDERGKEVIEDMIHKAALNMKRAQGKRKRQVEAKVHFWVAEIAEEA